MAGPVALSPAPDPLARSAEESRKESNKRLDDTLSELASVPETPAAFALGISAETVAHPTTIREAVAEIKTLFGPDGELVPGAALEIAPFYRLASAGTYQQWRDQVWRPLIGGLRLSLATASDPDALEGTDAPVLLAVGARIGFDGTDPRYGDQETIDAIKDALIACAPKRVPLTPGGPVVVQSEPCDYDAKENEIVEKLTGFRAELAGVLVYENTTTADQDADLRGWQAWLAADYKVTAWLSLGLGADSARKKVADQTERRNRVGARFAASNEAYALSLSGAYARDSEAETNWFDLGGTVSAQLGSTVALKLGAQAAQNLDEDESRLTVVVALGTATDDPVFSKYLNGGGTQ